MASEFHDTLAWRLAEILRLLHLGEQLDRQQLAERFGVSERTIYRDLNRLGDVIAPLGNGRIQLAAEYQSELSPTDLQAFARLSGVEQMFPSAISRRSWLELLKQGNTSFLVRNGHFEASQPHDQVFRQLRQAIERRQRCRMLYTDKTRQVEPYLLIHNKGIWYLAATESGHLKSFALGRICDLQVMQEVFEPLPEVQNQIHEDDDIWFGQNRFEVTLQVAADNAHYFLRRNVLPRQELIEQRENGQLLLRCQANHPNQLLPIIRYWIPHLRIIEPVWLQQKLLDELNDYLQ